jgi:hypothetical protein
MSVVDSRTDSPPTDSQGAASVPPALQVPWQAHAPFTQQAAAALRRSYAAKIEQTYVLDIGRREEALLRWRGLATDADGS